MLFSRGIVMEAKGYSREGTAASQPHPLKGVCILWYHRLNRMDSIIISNAILQICRIHKNIALI